VLQGAQALRAKIESVTAEMTEVSASGDWERAAELGSLRRDLLEALFPATADPAEEVSLIERILQSDESLAAHARKKRGEIADELAGQRHNRRAVGAYREAASTEI
jgi:hypothetical protein